MGPPGKIRLVRLLCAPAKNPSRSVEFCWIGHWHMLASWPFFAQRGRNTHPLKQRCTEKCAWLEFIPWKLSYFSLVLSIFIDHLPSITEVYFLLSLFLFDSHENLQSSQYGRPLLHRFHRLFGDHVDYSLRLALVLPLGITPAEPHRHVRRLPLHRRHFVDG